MTNATRRGNNPPDLMSIGDIAEATGISPDTIRVWERRYGRPVPVRLPSGHRRYTVEHIRWLRRVAEALALGHRPSAVVHMREEDLDKLLFPEAERVEERREVDAIIELTRNYQSEALTREIAAAQERLGDERFITDWVSPLMDAVGRSWADGELEIRHEHFLSELMDDHLRRMRAALVRPPDGAMIVATTLSGESHGLGLQMVAILCALQGLTTCVLGTHSPNAEIAAAVSELDAAGLALSVSLATGGVQTDRVIGDLRRSIDPRVAIAVGGRGARNVRRGPRGVDYITDMNGLRKWIQKMKASRAIRN